MDDDGSYPADMTEAVRRQRRRAALDAAAAASREPVMQAQARSRERVSRRDTPHGPVVGRSVDGAMEWTLHGSPVVDGAVLEIYTNRANGWVRGQVVGQRSDRPRLLVTLWNPWGPRDVDGLPPQVGSFEIIVGEGSMCRWSAALAQEID